MYSTLHVWPDGALMVVVLTYPSISCLTQVNINVFWDSATGHEDILTKPMPFFFHWMNYCVKPYFDLGFRCQGCKHFVRDTALPDTWRYTNRPHLWVTREWCLKHVEISQMNSSLICIEHDSTLWRRPPQQPSRHNCMGWRKQNFFCSVYFFKGDRDLPMAEAPVPLPLRSKAFFLKYVLISEQNNFPYGLLSMIFGRWYSWYIWKSMLNVSWRLPERAVSADLGGFWLFSPQTSTRRCWS